ncbi:hypothetical protein ROZALSC1DRAFT_28197 [Rozella allomycis CSF55]|uniref:I/LWEQ domain-containing protein n=1 Tax=Rozella allomycis (strain CSF55) TaxID=988480 RepID=A0A075AV43_ROZAC|nr:I/LWEQ domain-containing protein [Rozella allomycis CSF55]RKP20309.1 hypothetical protein ROZALSC1DRAFT_28197 [Rozella allomycis CSF55]|eukprot:EPZ34171.1 I/LWEQ domain-containing protein [Rozella allomycis CSF55]
MQRAQQYNINGNNILENQNYAQQISLWQEKYNALASLHQKLRSDYDAMVERTTTIQAIANQNMASKDMYEQKLRDKEMELANIAREKHIAQQQLRHSVSDYENKLSQVKGELTKTQSQASLILSSRDSQMNELHMKNEQEKNAMNDIYQRTLDELEQLKMLYAQAQSSCESLEGQKSQLMLQVRNLEKQIELTQNELLSAKDSLNSVNSSLQNQMVEVSRNSTNLVRGCINSSFKGACEALMYIQGLKESSLGHSSTNSIELFKLDLEYALEDLCKSMLEYIETNDGLNVIVNVPKVLVYFTLFSSQINANPSEFNDLVHICIQYFQDMESGTLDSLPLEHQKSIIEDGCRKIKTRLELFIESKDDLAMIKDTILYSQDHAAKLTISFSATVHSEIAKEVQLLVDSIALLIQRATECQNEVSFKKVAVTLPDSYKKINRWTQGLISAAKHVSVMAKVMVEAANKVLLGETSSEFLIVSCQEVTASTAQLIASACVEMEITTSSIQSLKSAGAEVKRLSISLLEKVSTAFKLTTKENDDYSKMSLHDLKVSEMNQNVLILQLEQQIAQERKKLADMRKSSYHRDVV